MLPCTCDLLYCAPSFHCSRCLSPHLRQPSVRASAHLASRLQEETGAGRSGRRHHHHRLSSATGKSSSGPFFYGHEGKFSDDGGVAVSSSRIAAKSAMKSRNLSASIFSHACLHSATLIVPVIFVYTCPHRVWCVRVWILLSVTCSLSCQSSLYILANHLSYAQFEKITRGTVCLI
jgi:hypothetical protein